jgi:uncharacterized protein (DUF427 family)
MIEAMFNGRAIAGSEQTVLVEANYYFPPADAEPWFL